MTRSKTYAKVFHIQRLRAVMTIDQREADYQDDDDMEFESNSYLECGITEPGGSLVKIIKNLHFISDMILERPKMLHAEPSARGV